jgi:hypothetical protein
MLAVPAGPSDVIDGAEEVVFWPATVSGFQVPVPMAA